MAGRPAAEQRAIEQADVDALACASLQAHLDVLLREAYATGNVPRYERLLTMRDTLEAMRLRVIARKE